MKVVLNGLVYIFCFFGSQGTFLIDEKKQKNQNQNKKNQTEK